MNELRRLRLNLGMSVDDLSAKADVPVTTIYNLEAGRVLRSRDTTLLKLAAVLGVPAGDLAAGLLAAQREPDQDAA